MIIKTVLKFAYAVALVTLLMFTVQCNGQPKSTYEIGCDAVTGAVEYRFFIEKKSTNPYKIEQGVDYLDPNGDGDTSDSISVLGQNTEPLFALKLDNDGAEYRVAVVAVNSSGIYSGMGTLTGSVNKSPDTPGGVFFRKKQ